MTGNQTLIARAVLGVVAGTAGIFAVSSKRLRALPSSQFDRLISAAFVVSRVAAYLGVFFVLRLPPRGDIPGFYWPEAMQVLHGLLPYRDFSSSYAPLHAYLDAALARLWPSPLVIILFSVVCECVMFPLWLELGRRVVSDQQLRSSALLYLSSAISLQFVAIDGQDNVVIATLFLLSILLLLRGRPLLSGGCVGLGASVIKFLPLLYAPLFFFTVPRRWRWAAGLALPVLLIYGVFVAKHLPILSVLRVEGGFKSANNLPYLVEAMLGITLPSLLLDGIVAAFLLLIYILVARATRAQGRLSLRPLVFGMAALTLVLVLFPKKSWPPYFLLGFFPVCLLIPMGSRIRQIAFVLFGLIAIVGPSYWATVLSQFSSIEFHHALLEGRADCLLFLALQTLLLTGYIWLLAAAIRQILTSPSAGLPSHPYAERPRRSEAFEVIQPDVPIRVTERRSGLRASH